MIAHILDTHGMSMHGNTFHCNLCTTGTKTVEEFAEHCRKAHVVSSSFNFEIYIYIYMYEFVTNILSYFSSTSLSNHLTLRAVNLS